MKTIDTYKRCVKTYDTLEEMIKDVTEFDKNYYLVSSIFDNKKYICIFETKKEEPFYY